MPGKNLVARAIKYVVRWALTTRDGVDSGDFPASQVLYLGRPGDAIAWYPYGLHANAPAGELAVLFAMGGDPASRVALPGSPKRRPHPIEVGEVVLYHPATGTKVHLKANGALQIDAKGLIDVDGAAGADVDVTGTITVDATGAITVNSGGNVTVNGTGNVAIAGTAKVTLDAPTIEAALGATLKLLNEVALATFNGHIHTVPGNPNTSVPTTLMVVGTDTTTKLRGS